jgi:hypothetical protein
MAHFILTCAGHLTLAQQMPAISRLAVYDKVPKIIIYASLVIWQAHIYYKDLKIHSGQYHSTSLEHRRMST